MSQYLNMQNTLITKKELIQDVDGMFQFVITISIFFLTFIDNLFKMGNETSAQSGLVQIQWTTALIVLVISYMLFRIFGSKIKDRLIKAVNILLFAEVLSIVTAIAVVLKYNNAITSYIGYYALKVSLWSAVLVPLAILVLTIIGIFSSKNLNIKRK